MGRLIQDRFSRESRSPLFFPLARTFLACSVCHQANALFACEPLLFSKLCASPPETQMAVSLGSSVLGLC